MRTALLAGLVAAVATTAVANAPAHAQDADVEAELLFREGKALLKAGKVAQACAKFEASELRAHNINTTVNLADCREQNGQYASAWGLFLKTSSEARLLGQSALEKAASTRATGLEAKLSYLTLVVAESNRAIGLTVSRDGATIEPALWNSAVPIDGGTYTIAATAPGHETWTTTVEVAAADARATVDVPPLVVVLAEPTKARDQETPRMERPERKQRSGKGRRVLGYTLSGVGIVALGAGGYAGLRARSAWTDVQTLCPERRCTDENAFARADGRVDDARAAGNLSTVLVGAGVAVTLTGLIVWLTAPDDVDRARPVSWRITPTAARDVSGFALTGHF